MNSVILLLLGLFNLARSQCPAPYEAVGSECFLLVKNNVDWMTAKAKCQELGGYLAVPSNVPILRQFTSAQIGNRPVWVGGTDVAQEGDWQSYINGQPINPDVFEPLEPNNYRGNEDCLELGWSNVPLLNDKDCLWKQSYVCEVDICPSNDLICQHPFNRVGDECFFVSWYSAPWKLARLICHYFEADLAIPSNPSSFTTIAEGRPRWIGGADMEAEGDWVYVNGDIVNSDDWYPGQPDNNNGDEHCLSFWPNITPHLKDERCGKYWRFVCEKPPVCAGAVMKDYQVPSRLINLRSQNITEPISTISP